MSDGTGFRKLREWFDSGLLVRPSAQVPHFMDLVHALAALAGAEGMKHGPGAEEIRRMIGPADHYLFVLVDGMGLHQLEHLPEKGFLRSSVAARLHALFPSTTATALTSLGTGVWPCVHGVPGWWTRLEEAGISAVTLPFLDRATESPLEDRGVFAQEVFPVPSFWPELENGALSILPAEILDTTYSTYMCGNTPRIGYAGIADALEKARDAVLDAPEHRFTYLYLPQLDTLCHGKGTKDQEVQDLLRALDQRLLRLCESVAGRARIVVSADHGQTEVPEERIFALSEGDSLLSHLRCLPTGEPNVPIFHVQQGRAGAFAVAFRERFGEIFTLLTPEQIEGLGLLGPDPLSRTMKARLGTFVGLCGEPAAICCGPPEKSGARNLGFHGGLSAAEMDIPLILP